MPRIWLALLLPFFFTTTVFGQAAHDDRKLIPVKPVYQEASYAPQEPAAVVNDPAESNIAPRPRDQMYFFWILGRVITYPIDKVEDFIRNRKQAVAAKPEPVVQTAPVSNPFDGIEFREIPPAPPALAGAAVAEE
ncbi:MAG: hypothetical protein V2B18_23750 [Pseudomonadota bacterium]